MTPACPCGEDHAPRAAYYVSATRDDGRRAIGCGPYPTHGEALAEVDPAREACYRLDPTTWWLGWGTCGSDDTLPARWSRAAEIKAG